MPDWIFDSCTVSHRCRIVQLVSKMAPHYILTVLREMCSNKLLAAGHILSSVKLDHD